MWTSAVSKIMVRGKPVQISDLHSGQMLTATIITAGPPHVMTQQEVQATLATRRPGCSRGSGRSQGLVHSRG